tara:strand:- start:559 stop:1035 length:477 start_codon:yes stop_codon:yes gene_type:complete
MAFSKIAATTLSDDIISGKTALASIPAETDEVLVSDNGTLKRMDYSIISQGHVKVWAHWDAAGTPSLTDSFGVSSITDEGTGTTDVNFTTALGNANYSCMTGGSTIASTGNQQMYLVANNITDSDTVRIEVRKIDIDGNTFAVSDMANVHMVICGDNA